jgi:hypothetical protein
VIRTQDTPPGYAYFRNLQQFFAATHYWKMKPVEEAASDGFCMADAGHEYIVFLNVAAPFALNLDGLAKALKAVWHQPFTGAHAAGPSVGTGRSSLTPPVEWGSGPVALHLV